MCRLFALGLVALAPALSAAQPPGQANRDALKKLAFLEGKWAGPATAQLGPGPGVALRQTEDVQLRAGGTVLVVEGIGRGKRPGSDEEAVLFNALAVISYDAAAGAYQMKAYRAEGLAVEPHLTVGDKGFVWGFKDPQHKVEVRYTMKLTEKGEWHEVGEVSLDGKTWRKTFEMTLTKVKE